MERVLNGYRPEAVFDYFEQLCAIPHGSYHEAAAADFLCAFARERGLVYRHDEMHNVLIRKPASAGYENEPVVMLQGHTDMVCEKNAGMSLQQNGGNVFIARGGMLAHEYVVIFVNRTFDTALVGKRLQKRRDPRLVT